MPILDDHGNVVEHPEIRSAEEIQRAHDQLTGILLTRQLLKELDPAAREVLTAACDVLCWVLKHEHNQTFGKNLQEFEHWIEQYGFQMTPVKPQ